MFILREKSWPHLGDNTTSFMRKIVELVENKTETCASCEGPASKQSEPEKLASLYISHPVLRVPIYFRFCKLHPILYPPSLFHSPCFISSSDPFPPGFPPSFPPFRPAPLAPPKSPRPPQQWGMPLVVFIFCLLNLYSGLCIISGS